MFVPYRGACGGWGWGVNGVEEMVGRGWGAVDGFKLVGLREEGGGYNLLY